MRLMSLVFPSAKSAVIAAVIVACFAATAHAQSNDAVAPPFFQISGIGGVYDSRGFAPQPASGGETECLTGSYGPPEIGAPPGADPSNDYPTTDCDAAAGAELSQILSEDFLWGTRTLTMSGATQEIANVSGVEVQSRLESVGSENGGFVAAFASYYQEYVTAAALPGRKQSFSFVVDVDGVGAATFASVCLWNDDGTDQICHAEYTGGADAFTLQLSIGASGKYTIYMEATTLNETVGTFTDAAIRLLPEHFPVDQFDSFLVPGGINPTVRDSNKNGDSVGIFTTSSGATEGFEALPGGSITPIVAPSDNAGFTVATGINDPGTVVGAFEENVGGGVDRYRGYLLKNGSFTTYDEGPDVSTAIFGINEKGDFTGTFFGFDGNNEPVQAYIQSASGGAPVTFSVPGASASYAEGLNNSDAVVGLWADSNGVTHGFYLPSGGSTPISFDFPGAVNTSPFSINDVGAINGYFTDASGVNHGFVGPLGQFVQYDLAGAASSGPLALNNEGVVGGSYIDTQGTQHGFTAQLCTPNVSNSVKVTAGGYVHNKATGEFTQEITVTNTSTRAIFGPILILLEDLPFGVIVDNGNLMSVCAAPGTPYVNANLPANQTLQPGKQATTAVNFANFSAGHISHKTSVLAGPLVP